MKKFIGSEAFGIGLLIATAVIVMVMLFSNCGDTGVTLLLKQIPGPQGDIGDAGSRGVPGIDGQNGANGVDGQNGIDGQNGANGVDGQNGIDGSNCTTFNVPGGAIIQCTDGTSSIVSDGQLGSMIEVLNPCGDANRQDEVFLKFTDSEGTLTVIAFFTDNGSALFSRLSVLKCNGTTIYETTDGQRCTFKLDTECNLIY